MAWIKSLLYLSCRMSRPFWNVTVSKQTLLTNVFSWSIFDKVMAVRTWLLNLLKDAEAKPRKVHISAPPNPSHLESINAVVQVIYHHHLSISISLKTHPSTSLSICTNHLISTTSSSLCIPDLVNDADLSSEPPTAPAFIDVFPFELWKYLSCWQTCVNFPMSTERHCLADKICPRVPTMRAHSVKILADFALVISWLPLSLL